MLGRFDAWTLGRFDAWTLGCFDTWTLRRFDASTLGHLDASMLGHFDASTLRLNLRIGSGGVVVARRGSTVARDSTISPLPWENCCFLPTALKLGCTPPPAYEGVES